FAGEHGRLTDGARKGCQERSEVRFDGKHFLLPGLLLNHGQRVPVQVSSVAAAAGENVRAALLTGMGTDGAEGLLAMRQDAGPGTKPRASSPACPTKRFSAGPPSRCCRWRRLRRR